MSPQLIIIILVFVPCNGLNFNAIIKLRRIRVGKKRNVYRVLVQKPEGESPLGRPGSSWEDNMNMMLKTEWKSVFGPG